MGRRRALALALAVALVALASPTAVSAEPTHYWVDGIEGSDDNPGTAEEPVQTIAQALQLGSAGNAVINVLPALYEEPPLVLGDTVSLFGAPIPFGDQRPHVGPTAEPASGCTSWPGLIRSTVVVQGDDVTIAGLTLDPGTYQGAASSVYVEAVAGNPVERLTVRCNLIDANFGGVKTLGLVTTTGENQVTDLLVERNTIRNIYGGMYLNPGVNNVTVDGNIIHHILNSAVSSQADATVVKGNLITDSTTGVWIEKFGSGSRVYRNTFERNIGQSLDYTSTTGTLDAAQNWWGHETGPVTDGVPDPSAPDRQQVRGDVELYPWCDQTACPTVPVLIEATVTDAEGNAIGDVDVTATWGTDPLSSVTLDEGENGALYAGIADLQPDELPVAFTVVGEKAGQFAPALVSLPETDDARIAVSLELINAYATVSVSVFDATTSVGIAGAEIRAKNPDVGTVLAGPATMSTPGEYEIAVPPDTLLDLWVEHGDYVTRIFEGLEYGAGQQATLGVALGANGTVEGTVTDGAGTPLDGDDFVTATRVDGGQGGDVVFSTDASGAFSQALPPGRYDLEFDYPDHRPLSLADIVVEEDAVTGVDTIVLTGFGTVTVTVEDWDTEDPVTGATVALSRPDQELVTLDGDDGEPGSYSGTVDVGQYTLRVGKAGYETVTMPDLVVTKGGSTTPEAVRLITADSGVVNGVVEDGDGNEVGGATVVAKNADGVVVDNTTSDGDGDFTFQLPAGSYTLEASADGHTSGSTTVEVVAGEVSTGTTIELQAHGSVSGVVRATDNVVASHPGVDVDDGTGTGEVALPLPGDPIPGATVTAYDEGCEVVVDDCVVGFAVTDDEGVYTLENVPVGWYTLIANAERFEDQTIGGVEVDPGQATEGQNFELVPYGVVTGVIGDDADELVPGAVVQAYLGGELFATSDQTVAENGRYTLWLPHSDDWTLIASAPQHSPSVPATVAIQSRARTEQDFQLDRFGVLTVNVTAVASGDAILGAGVVVHDSVGAALDDYSGVTSGDGSYMVPLPAGDYSLTVGADNMETTGVTGVTVSAGGSVSRAVALYATDFGRITGTVRRDSGNILVVGAAITAVDAEDNGYPASSGTDGTYALSLPAGTYTLRISAGRDQTGNWPHLDGEIVGVEVVVSQTVENLDVTLVPMGKITGQVFDSANGTPLEADVHATSDGQNYEDEGSAASAFEIYVPPSETFTLVTDADCYEGRTLSGLTVASHGEISRNVSLSPTGCVEGTVTSATEAALTGVQVMLTSIPDGVETSADVDEDGSFFVEAPPGDYQLSAVADGHDASDADVSLEAGTALVQPITLEPYGTLGLTVVDAKDEAVKVNEATVTVTTLAGESVGSGETGSEGTLDLALPKGDYVALVEAAGYEPFVIEAFTISSAEPTLKDAKLTPLAVVTGVVTDADSAEGIEGVLVLAQSDDHEDESAVTDESGMFEFALPAGSWTLQPSKSGYDPAEGTPLNLEAGEIRDGFVLTLSAAVEPTVSPSPPPPPSGAPPPVVSPSPSPTASPTPTPSPTAAPGPLPGAGPRRVSGGDRTSTAASVSAFAFAGGADVVFVATGNSFADALAGGPAAAHFGGPVLLVTRDGLPESTRVEIERLGARRIIVLGGEGAVSSSVQAQLQSLGADVQRMSGTDRFATAAAVSKATFPERVSVVYIATGNGFADALSGGAAAARNRGPVLLVGGDGIPSSTAEELRRLNPRQIVVLGGNAAIPPSVASQLDDYTDGAVERLSGPDRYATSAAIAERMFPVAVDTVFVATGENFPDALAGVPAAAREKAPLLLLRRDAIPEVIATQLQRLRPRRIVILGGSGAVSPATERELSSYTVE